MIEISDLSFGFGKRALFEGLDFTVKPGELVHVVGPNGVGKSTLMSIVAGLLSARTGSVILRTAEGSEADDRRECIEYVPAEANALFLKLDAVANLRFWCDLRGTDSSLATLIDALKVWSLDHPLIRERFAVEKFSTGMKRRLALARLMLSPSPCWLLDEPIYGLDRDAIAVFRAQLAKHLHQGGYGIVVSHDTEPLQGLSTRTLELGRP